MSRTSVISRFAIAFWLMSSTEMPSTTAIVRPESTITRPCVRGFWPARWALKWFWFVFIDSSVSHVLSASVIVLPSGCW
ncbi:MAG: hypothetical protein QOJ30_6605 [Pseudonocardiales bacterium]|nr:hypothetical protein [Pseudonocardiales bacterium]